MGALVALGALLDPGVLLDLGTLLDPGTLVDFSALVEVRRRTCILFSAATEARRVIRRAKMEKDFIVNWEVLG